MASTKETSLTLYEAEEHLQALLDTEEMVTPEQEEQFKADMAVALKKSIDKREACGQYILQAEAAAEFCKAEAKRIRARGEQCERLAERVRGYVLHCIMSQGLDTSARFPKLEGRTLTMRAQSNPASVEIVNQDSVPARFKTAKVEMPFDLWQVIVDAFPSDTAGALKGVDVDKRAVKAAIDKGEEVVGADLVIGRYHLRIR